MSSTTTLLLLEKFSKMNCTHFGQNIHKNNEKWRYLEIFINKKIRHLEKNSKSGNTLKDEALFTGTLQKSNTKPLGGWQKQETNLRASPRLSSHSSLHKFSALNDAHVRSPSSSSGSQQLSRGF